MPSNDVLGRAADLSQVAVWLDRARLGPSALCLAGPAGIGKSTIWRAATALADRQGFRVLMARPVEAEAKYPFAGLVDLLSPAVDAVLGSLPAPQAAAIEIALRRAAPGPVPPDPLTIALGALGAFRHLAQAKPVLIAVDDLPWLDASTAHVLGFVARRLSAEPISLLASVRRQHDEEPPELAVAFGQSQAEQLHIGPLNLDAIDQVLRERMNLALPRPTLLRIERVSGGNPFFALEIGRALLRRGLDGTANALPIPDSLADLVRDRLEALSPPATDAVLIAAALADPTPALLLADRDARMPPREGFQEAVRAGVLEPHGPGLRFSHPLLASTAYEMASPSERRRIHARIARAGRNMLQPEERARHLALGYGRPSEYLARALDAGARAAHQRGASEAAGELARMARSHTPEHRRDERRRRGLAAAEYLLQAGAPGEAQALLRELLALEEPGPRRAEVLVLLADTHSADDWGSKIRLLEQATREDSGGPARIAAERSLAGAAWMTLGSFAVALERARTALRLAEALGDPAEIAASVTCLAIAELDAEGSTRYTVDDLLRLDGVLQSARIIFRPAFTAALMAAWHDPRAARQRFESLRKEAVAIGDWDSMPRILLELAFVDLAAGHWDAALQLAQTALQTARQIGQPLSQAAALAVVAEIEARRGRDGEARRAADEAIALSRGVGGVREQMWAEQVLGFLALSQGDAAAANRLIGPAVKRYLAVGYRHAAGWAALLPDAIEALVMLGELDEAAELLTVVEKMARGAALHGGGIARGRALVAAARGDLSGAIRAAEDAVADHERAGEPFELARSRLVFGEVLRRARRSGAARGAIEAALRGFDQLGAALWAGRARASLGRSASPAASSGDAVLSPTQRSIVELVAAGKTNREVAADLFMSPHTVDSHLRKIYRLLGIRSRAELAARVAERG